MAEVGSMFLDQSPMFAESSLYAPQYSGGFGNIPQQVVNPDLALNAGGGGDWWKNPNNLANIFTTAANVIDPKDPRSQIVAALMAARGKTIAGNKAVAGSGEPGAPITPTPTDPALSFAPKIVPAPTPAPLPAATTSGGTTPDGRAPFGINPDREGKYIQTDAEVAKIIADHAKSTEALNSVKDHKLLTGDSYDYLSGKTGRSTPQSNPTMATSLVNDLSPADTMWMTPEQIDATRKQALEELKAPSTMAYQSALAEHAKAEAANIARKLNVPYEKELFMTHIAGPTVTANAHIKGISLAKEMDEAIKERNIEKLNKFDAPPLLAKYTGISKSGDVFRLFGEHAGTVLSSAIHYESARSTAGSAQQLAHQDKLYNTWVTAQGKLAAYKGMVSPKGLTPQQIQAGQFAGTKYKTPEDEAAIKGLVATCGYIQSQLPMLKSMPIESEGPAPVKLSSIPTGTEKPPSSYGTEGWSPEDIAAQEAAKNAPELGLPLKGGQQWATPQYVTHPKAPTGVVSAFQKDFSGAPAPVDTLTVNPETLLPWRSPQERQDYYTRLMK